MRLYSSHCLGYAFYNVGHNRFSCLDSCQHLHIVKGAPVRCKTLTMRSFLLVGL